MTERNQEEEKKKDNKIKKGKKRALKSTERNRGIRETEGNRTE